MQLIRMRIDFRHILIAAGGCTLVASSPPTSNVAKPVAQRRTGSAPVPSSTVKLRTPDAARAYRPPCTQPENNDRCDLEAQWVAAAAADRSASWGIAQAIFSALGLIGLIWSLYYTRRAVLVAEGATTDAIEALKVASRNADATVDMVRVAQDTAHVQLRAYLDFDGVTFDPNLDERDDGTTVVNVSVVLKNYGQTPARDLIVGVQYQIKNALGITFHFTPTDQRKHVTIAPQDTGTQNEFVVLNDDLVRNLQTGAYQLIALFDVRYRDVFGQAHTLQTNFQSMDMKRPLGLIPGSRFAD